jgi:uncharacterized protein (TIGR02996 family)
MSDEKALLAAIWEHPHDDTPRLVYADWLQETGEPANVARAEFIRLQCEKERLDEWDDSERRGQLQSKAFALQKKHGMTWKRGLPRSLESAGFSRGFLLPKRRRFSGEKFLKVTGDELAHAPLWEFSLTGVFRNFDRVLAAETLKRAGSLVLDLRSFPDDAAAKLASCPYLKNIVQLELDYPKVSASGVATLLNSGSLPSLRELRLAATPVPGNVLRAISESRIACQLTHLRIGTRHIPGGVPPTFSPKFFPRLTSLDLCLVTVQEGFEEGSIEQLVASNLPTLRSLNLTWCQLTDYQVRLIAEWPGALSLRRLDLIVARYGAEGLLALAHSRYLAGLKELRVSRQAALTYPDAAAELAKRYGRALRYG